MSKELILQVVEDLKPRKLFNRFFRERREVEGVENYCNSLDNLAVFLVFDLAKLYKLLRFFVFRTRRFAVAGYSFRHFVKIVIVIEIIRFFVQNHALIVFIGARARLNAQINDLTFFGRAN